MRKEWLAILLVEDNLDHAELVRRTLDDVLVAHRVIHLEDGEAALDYLFHRGEYADADQAPTPDLVLLDLRLPKVDGLEVLRRLKQTPELAAIPVVVLTTSEAERDVARAYQNHANSYVTKPVDYGKFNQLLHDLGAYWLSWNRRPTC